VEFHATVVDGPEGLLAWVQLLNWNSRAYFPNDPTIFYADPAIGPGEYIISALGLDFQYPTKEGSDFDDSPLASAPNHAAGPGGTFEHEGTFKTYVFWASARLQSIPVPVRRIDWDWSFTAAAEHAPVPNNPERWAWGPPSTTSANLSGAYIDDAYPEWNRVVDMGLQKWSPLG
jgi:hypothetical protein